MLNLAQILEEKLSEAVNVKDEKALKRYINLLVESVMERQKANEQFVEIRGGIKVLAETMQEGFRRIDKRFEAADRRFEAADKRFEELIHYMDKRFEAVDRQFEAVDKHFEELIHNMDKRFEAVDKRFEELVHYMDKRFEELIHNMDKRFEAVDKRFEDLNKRIGFMSWFTPTIITILLTLIMAAMKFL